jgi:hypothetical protein
MNKLLLSVVLISTILFIDACFDNGKNYKDGEEWEVAGVKKRCKLYTEGQGIISIIESAGGEGYGGESPVVKPGHKQATDAGKTFANVFLK